MHIHVHAGFKNENNDRDTWIFKKKEDKVKKLRGKDLRKTNLAGIWKNRKDIKDSTDFVRSMRDSNQYRGKWFS